MRIYKNPVPGFEKTKTIHSKRMTLPEIAKMRAVSDRENLIWNSDFTSVSAEFCGLSKGGNPLLIVCENGGPLYGAKDFVEKYLKGDSGAFARISKNEFFDLESGKYENVSVIDLKNYSSKHDYPFIGKLSQTNLLKDEVVRAYFGESSDAYIESICSSVSTQRKHSFSIEPFCDSNSILYKITKMLGGSIISESPIGMLVSVPSFADMERKQSPVSIKKKLSFNDFIFCHH